MTLTEITDRVDIHLVMVSSVDNEGEACTHCDDATHTVQANVYLSCPDGEVLETCLHCVVPVVKEHAEAGHMITVEVAA